MSEPNNQDASMFMEWEGDIYKDTITYRYLELSASLLELGLQENKGLIEAYENWLAANAPKESEKGVLDAFLGKTAVLSEYSPEQDTKAIIYSLPRKGEFLSVFTTPKFKVSVSFLYDFEREDFKAGKILKFEGDGGIAVVWAESLISRLDKLFEELAAE